MAKALILLMIFVPLLLISPDTKAGGAKVPEEYIAEGNAFVKAKDYVNALALYNKALQINPNFVPFYLYKANALIELERYDDALMEYDKAIQVNSDEAEAYIHKCILLNLLGRHKDALKTIDILGEKNRIIRWYTAIKELR